MTLLLDSFHNIGYMWMFIINATYNDHAPANFIFLSKGDVCDGSINVRRQMSVLRSIIIDCDGLLTRLEHKYQVTT